MRRIDELLTSWPFLGSPQGAAVLRGESHAINRQRVQRLMQDGDRGARAEPRNSKPAPGEQDLPLSAARRRDLVRRHHLQCASLREIGGHMFGMH